jgi:hypothetical protein
MPTTTPLYDPDRPNSQPLSSTSRSMLPAPPAQPTAQSSVRIHCLGDRIKWGTQAGRPGPPLNPSIRVHSSLSTINWGRGSQISLASNLLNRPVSEPVAAKSHHTSTQPSNAPPITHPSSFSSPNDYARGVPSYQDVPPKIFSRHQVLPVSPFAKPESVSPEIAESPDSRGRFNMTLKEEAAWQFEVDEDEAPLGSSESEAREAGSVSEGMRVRLKAGCEGVSRAWRSHEPASLKARILEAAGEDGWSEFVTRGCNRPANDVWDALEAGEREGEDAEIRRVGLDREACRRLQEGERRGVYGDTGVEKECRTREDMTTVARELYIGSTKKFLNRLSQHLSILSRFRNPSTHYNRTHKFLDDVLGLKDRRLVIDEGLLAQARARGRDGTEEEKGMGERLEAMLRGLEGKENPNYEVAGHVYVLLWAMSVSSMDEQLRRWGMMKEGISLNEKEVLRHGLLELVEASILVSRRMVTSKAAEEAAPSLRKWKLRSGLESTNV